MNTPHCSEAELDALAAGEPLDHAAGEHVRGCTQCRDRLEFFAGAVGAAGAAASPEKVARQVLADAMDRWRRPGARAWWAAAALVLVALAAGVWLRPAPRGRVDPAGVLAEVDAVLAQDPVALVASEDLLALLAAEVPENHS